MRYLSAVLFAVTSFAVSSPAYAYCCWNPAICQAVCGAACCGADLKIATPVSPDRLGNFQIQDLMSTYNQAETEANRAGLKSSDFLTVLGNEIKRRGGR